MVFPLVSIKAKLGTPLLTDNSAPRFPGHVLPCWSKLRLDSNPKPAELDPATSTAPWLPRMPSERRPPLLSPLNTAWTFPFAPRKYMVEESSSRFAFRLILGPPLSSKRVNSGTFDLTLRTPRIFPFESLRMNSFASTVRLRGLWPIRRKHVLNTKTNMQPCLNLRFCFSNLCSRSVRDLKSNPSSVFPFSSMSCTSNWQRMATASAFSRRGFFCPCQRKAQPPSPGAIIPDPDMPQSS